MNQTSLTTLTLLALAVGLTATSFAVDVPSNEVQIAAAVLAAPEPMRAGAAVIGWSSEGKPVTLREGSNELVCLYSNPAAPRFSVACYHKDLEPYMARGRELVLEGITGPARQKKRFEEVEAGELALPKEPHTLYVLHGDGYDAASGTITSPYERWVLYVPYATPESTGLATTPTESAPWLMDPGTPGAHIMINPPRPK